MSDLIKRLRETHDRLICRVAPGGQSFKTQADYEADCESASSLCWEAADQIVMLTADRDRLAARVRELEEVLDYIRGDSGASWIVDAATEALNRDSR